MLYTDAQSSAVFVRLARAVGYEVTTVYETGQSDDPADENHLIFARHRGWVYVTFDKLRGETGVRVAREMRTRGGKLIQIQGGPEQPPRRALGKVLLHQERWEPFLTKGDGWVTIRNGEQVTLQRRQDVRGEKTLLGEKQFAGYVARRDARPPVLRRPRTRAAPSEQMSLNSQR